MSTTFRSDRAAEAIRAAISRIISEEMEDPRIGFVTITACEVSRDLQNAKIFYTVLGDEEAANNAQAAFERGTSFLRTRLGEELAWRTVPEILFRYDRSTDNAMRIEQILNSLPDLHPENESAPPADGAVSEGAVVDIPTGSHKPGNKRGRKRG